MRSRSCPSWCEALAVLVLAGCPARTPPPVAITGPEDVTEARLDALVRELVPLVEEAGGRRFTTVPQTRLGRPADLESVVEQEFRSILGRMIDAPEWVVDVLADDARHGVGGILGKYGVHSKVLYLAPDALFSAAHAAGLAPERAGDVARLILAHELTHALQDQAAGLDAVFHSVVDGEALDVVRMLTEGHANHVERAVAARLGLLDVSARLDLGQGWTDDRGPLTPDAFELWALYGHGRAYVDQLGDPEAIWALLARPPRTTTPLFRWDAGVELIVPDPDPLDGVERELTDEPWITSTRALGELSLREDGQGLDPAGLHAVLGHVTGAVAREAMRPDRRAAAWLIVLDDAAAAAAWLDLWASAASDARSVDVTEVAFGDRALRVVVGPPEPRAAAQEVHSTWVRVGARLIVVRAEGFRPGVRMDAAVRGVLARL